MHPMVVEVVVVEDDFVAATCLRRTTNAVGQGVNCPVLEDTEGNIEEDTYGFFRLTTGLASQAAQVRMHEPVQWMAVEVMMWSKERPTQGVKLQPGLLRASHAL